LNLLYNAIVLPHFDYADIVYDSTCIGNKIRLQLLQTRAARLISGSDPRTKRNKMFKELGWLSLQHRCDLHKCTMVFKCRHNLAPQYLIDLFQANDVNHDHETRFGSSLRATKFRTAYYERSFTISGHRLWNNLPVHIRNIENVDTFKTALEKDLSARVQFPNDRRY